MKRPARLAELIRHRLVGEAAWVFAGQILSALGTLERRRHRSKPR